MGSRGVTAAKKQEFLPLSEDIFVAADEVTGVGDGVSCVGGVDDRDSCVAGELSGLCVRDSCIAVELAGVGERVSCVAIGLVMLLLFVC